MTKFTKSGIFSMPASAHKTFRCTSSAKAAAASLSPFKIFTNKLIVFSWLSVKVRSTVSPSALENVAASSPWMLSRTDGYWRRRKLETEQKNKIHVPHINFPCENVHGTTVTLLCYSVRSFGYIIIIELCARRFDSSIHIYGICLQIVAQTYVISVM